MLSTKVGAKKQKTSSFPSTVHFGQYNARTFNPEIMIINTKLAQILQQMGRPLRHWKKGLNVMLKKYWEIPA